MLTRGGGGPSTEHQCLELAIGAQARSKQDWGNCSGRQALSNNLSRGRNAVARPFEGHDPRGECLHHFIVLVQCLNIEGDNPAITLWIGSHVTDLDPES